MNNGLVVLTVAVLGATVFGPPAQAQRHGVSAAVGRPGTTVARRGAVRTRFIGSLRGARGFSSGSAFAPYFYSDYDSEPEAVEPPPAQVVGQAAQPSLPALLPNKAGALVLELQDDHWVRITNSGQSQSDGQSSLPQSERVSNPLSATPSATLRRTQADEPSSVLPRAVLVFRDGHEEEIAKYIIVGATIYTSADDWSGSSWTRKIQIADLDVPATLQLNRERSEKFCLPSGPNEVMIRQ
ncbi:MAG: hypothetical protein WA774_12710 [Candidatus Acidiferrales bacterium]